MRRIHIDDIQGTEILAKTIYTDMDTILMPEGTQLRKEYVSRLKSLEIEYIYVEDEISRGVETEKITEIQIKEECKEQLNRIWDRLSCNTSTEYYGVKEIADRVIEDLLERPEVIFCVSGVRNRSEMLYSHSLNVCAMSVFIALRMKLSKQKVEEIAEGSLLHDIGYTKIPDEIKEKSENEINYAEAREIAMHTIYGYNAVETESWVRKESKEIILCHHEHLDGSGYPFKRKGNKITKGSQIVCVCDTFDRMVYGIYMKKYKVHEAIEYIVAEAGRAFDREVVEVFNQSVAAYPNGTLVRTNEGEVGIVLRQNENFPARPVLRILKDKKGKICKEWIERNLEKELSLFIEDTIE